LANHQRDWAEQQRLIDHRSLDWRHVRRTRYFCYQRFSYAYPGPIHDLNQRLVVIPPPCYGDQVVIDQQLSARPHPTLAKQGTDAFGNRVWDLVVTFAECETVFETVMTIERMRPVRDPALSKQEAARFREPTPLTAADERIRTIAEELAATTRDQEEIAERISTWVSDVMSYGAGATGVNTTAAQALAIGKGLCQDYAHIMIALCRAAGLSARYVSGHMLAEGGSHAWVEVLLPDGEGAFRALGFDPTNRRRPDLRYVIVATGRDYRDVSPSSGRFSAPYGGQLSFTKFAGLTLVEFSDGAIVKRPTPPITAARC